MVAGSAQVATRTRIFPSGAGRRVDAGAHGRTTEREAIHALQRNFEAVQIVRQHPRIAGPFLAQRQRSGVLHVRTDQDLKDIGIPLDHRRKLFAAIAERQHDGAFESKGGIERRYLL
jgi:hypothetical protein